MSKLFDRFSKFYDTRPQKSERSPDNDQFHNELTALVGKQVRLLSDHVDRRRHEAYGTALVNYKKGTALEVTRVHRSGGLALKTGLVDEETGSAQEIESHMRDVELAE